VGFLSEDDVEAVLTDRRFTAVAIQTLELSGVTEGPLFDLWVEIMNSKNDEDHRRIRNTVARDFTPRAIETHSERIADIAERMADRLLNAARMSGGVADLWSDYAVPVTGRVSSGLVGIPEDDVERVAEWSIDLARAFLPFMSPEQRARADAAAAAFVAYVDDMLEARRLQPADDIASRLLADPHAADLSATELRALVANLVFAGIDTTAKAITTGVFHLLEHGKYAEVVADPAIIPTAVSELLRFLPPSPVLARFVPDDLVCQHVQLHAGQIASPDLMAACRDPSRYPNPDALDLRRDPGKQLAFGAGPHYCLGAHLAKLQLSIALRTLARRFPSLSLAAPDDVVWDAGGFAGIVSLPVRLAEGTR
jgi:cytochrome P450